MNGIRPPSPRTTPLAAAVWLSAVVLIAWSVAVTAIHALGYPLYDWDAFAIWGLKAKVLFDAPAGRASYFHDLPLSFSHLDYPLLVPFVTAGTYAAIGVVDDRLGKIAWPFLLVCWAIFLYGCARSRRSRVESAALTALGVGTPVMVQWAGAGNADVQLTIFYGASLYYLAAWIESRRAPDLRLAFVFTAACVFTKQEGLALAAVSAIVAVAFGGRTLRDVGGALLLFAALAAPWLVWRLGLPRTDENYLGHLRVATLIANAGRLRIILKYLIATMSRTDLWGFLWYLSGVTLAIGVFSGPNRVVLSALTALLAGHFAANVLAYLVTPWAIEAQLSSTIHRVVLHMMPGALLILLFGLPRGDDAGDRERHPFRGPARMPPVPSRAARQLALLWLRAACCQRRSSSAASIAHGLVLDGHSVTGKAIVGRCRDRPYHQLRFHSFAALTDLDKDFVGHDVLGHGSPSGA